MCAVLLFEVTAPQDASAVLAERHPGLVMIGGVLVSAVVVKAISMTVVNALHAAPAGGGPADPTYAHALAALIQKLAIHVVTGRPIFEHALRQEVAKDPGLVAKADRLRADVDSYSSSRGGGNCDKNRKQYLDDEVNTICKPQPKQCYARESCASMLDKIDIFTKCGDARRQVMDECYNGGNRGHQMKYTEQRTGSATCQGLLPTCQ